MTESLLPPGGERRLPQQMQGAPVASLAPMNLLLVFLAGVAGVSLLWAPALTGSSVAVTTHVTRPVVALRGSPAAALAPHAHVVASPAEQPAAASAVAHSSIAAPAAAAVAAPSPPPSPSQPPARVSASAPAPAASSSARVVSPPPPQSLPHGSRRFVPPGGAAASRAAGSLTRTPGSGSPSDARGALAQAVARANAVWRHGAWVRNESRGAATVYAHFPPSPERREYFFWEPFASDPPFLHFDRHQLCTLLAGRTIAMMGDSIQHQFYCSLQLLASDGSTPYFKKPDTKPRIILGARICQGTGYEAAVELAFNFWLNTVALPLPWGLPFFLASEFFANMTADAPSIFIVNRGAHYSPTAELLRDAAAAIRAIQAAYPSATIMWRNTPVGHPNCSRFTAPIASPLPMEGAPYDWDKITAQSAAVEALLAVEFPEVVYLDVAAASNLRPDGHATPKNNADCLHFRYDSPSVTDHWVRLLLNVLHLSLRGNLDGSSSPTAARPFSTAALSGSATAFARSTASSLPTAAPAVGAGRTGSSSS